MLHTSCKVVLPESVSLKCVCVCSFSGRRLMLLGAHDGWVVHLELFLATGSGSYLVPSVWWMQPKERELEGTGTSQLLKAQGAAYPGSAVLEFGTTPCLGVCCEIVGGALGLNGYQGSRFWFRCKLQLGRGEVHFILLNHFLHYLSKPNQSGFEPPSKRPVSPSLW